MALVTNIIEGSAARRLLLLVHGYGADERDLGGLLPYLDPDGEFVVVLPRGPIAAAGTPGFMWYDLGGNDESGFVEALSELNELVDEQCAAHEMARNEAIFAGFSQGGGLALGLGLFATDPALVAPAGVLAMSPFAQPGELAAGAANVPVLVQHGTNDPMIPVQRSRDLARELRGAGVPTVYREYPMEHQVALEGLQDARGVARPGASRGRSPTNRCPRIRSSSYLRSRPRSGRPRC